jgi:hypothetical protein
MRASDYLKTTVLGASLLVFGCNNDRTIIRYDNFQPSAPRGVTSYTGDEYVLLTWLANPEPDLAGYDVYRSTTDCSGPYSYYASTTDTSFVDYGVQNGNTYYYAVAAFDIDDLQSDLSYECVFDTPRPEGVVVLYDFNLDPNNSGFDFSTESVVAWNSSSSDIYLEYYVPNQIFYINANTGTDIQDYGYVDTLAQVGWAPQQGWSDLGYVEVVLGHAYILNTWDNHYAKIRVNEIGPNYVRLEWAYQVDQGNPELKPVVQDDSTNN